MISNSGHTITNEEEVRIVMVGKTGTGKSAAGNTILGRECFVSKFSAESMTVDCDKGTAVVDGQQVAVIDTPGLFDTRFDMDKTSKHVGQCISFAAPGPHMFLVVIRLRKYTKEEMKTVEKIQEVFGQAADTYSMVLFTGGDELTEDRTIQDFLKESLELQELVARCHCRYHVFNNKKKEDRSQVTELLQKIRDVVQKNGGHHYTNEMFQEADRKIKEEEKQRILKEKEEKTRAEREKLVKEINEKFEKQMKKITEQLQAERERERREREEERKREEEERKREKEEMRAERKRFWEEIEEQRKREREEIEMERNKLMEQHQRELREEIKKLQVGLEQAAMGSAERRDQGLYCSIL